MKFATDRRAVKRSSPERRSKIRIEVIYSTNVRRDGAPVQLFRIWAAGVPVFDCRRFPSAIVKGL